MTQEEIKNEFWKTVPGLEDYYEVSNCNRARSLDRYLTFTENGKECVRFHRGKILRIYVMETGHCRVSIHGHPELLHILVAKAFPEICGEWFEGCEVHHKDFDPTNNRPENLVVLTKEEHRLIHSHSEITREKRSKSIKEVWDKEGYREKTSKAIKESMSKPESIKKRSEISKEIQNSPEVREKKSKSVKEFWNNEGNREKMSKAMKNNPKLSKPVLQLTKDDILIAEYKSIREAERKTGISHTRISKCCNGINYKSAGGYLWKFAS